MTSVLIVRLSAMGDFVHGLAAIAALHAAEPGWSITVVTQPANVPLLDGVAGIARVVAFDRRGGLRALVRTVCELRRTRFDVALDFQGNWKSALLARLSGARRRLGAGAAWRREPASRVLLTEVIPIDGPNHPARIAATLVRRIAPAAVPARSHLAAMPSELARERRELEDIGVDARRPFRVVVVTDAADPRALRPVTIAGELQRGGMPVLFLIGPAERDTVPVGAPVLRHGAGEVRRLVALGNLLAAVGGEVTGPDQGATHVLVAAGADCRVLFGAQDPACTAPIGARVLTAPSPPSCSPCRSRRCVHPDGPVCMEFAVAEARPAP